MAKKTSKKIKKAATTSSKKIVKKPAAGKAKNAAIKSKKPAKAVKAKPKKVSAKTKPASKVVGKKQPPLKKASGKESVKKQLPKSEGRTSIPPKAEKPALPTVEHQKPKGSPFKLSMTLEEKETQQAVMKPRITRSRSGNLLFQLEYTIRSSPAILYEFLTTPSGMAQWFADSVDIEGHHCTFVWDGYPEYATIIDSIPDEYIRYRWDNSDEDEYFEFRISKNEITGDTILTITDFASDTGMKDQKLLWDSQIKTLVQQVGG